MSHSRRRGVRFPGRASQSRRAFRKRLSFPRARAYQAHNVPPPDVKADILHNRSITKNLSQISSIEHCRKARF